MSSWSENMTGQTWKYRARVCRQCGRTEIHGHPEVLAIVLANTPGWISSCG
ncbi:hypothetical protein M0Q03_02705 [bacterium]|nr:hypothetical protein [bacterium]